MCSWSSGIRKMYSSCNPKETLIKILSHFRLILSLFYVWFYRKKETKRDKKETKNEGGREDLGAKKLVLEIFLKFFSENFLRRSKLFRDMTFPRPQLAPSLPFSCLILVSFLGPKNETKNETSTVLPSPTRACSISEILVYPIPSTYSTYTRSRHIRHTHLARGAAVRAVCAWEKGGPQAPHCKRGHRRTVTGPRAALSTDPSVKGAAQLRPRNRVWSKLVWTTPPMHGCKPVSAHAREAALAATETGTVTGRAAVRDCGGGDAGAGDADGDESGGDGRADEGAQARDECRRRRRRQ